jgi:hypothetical protein
VFWVVVAMGLTLLVALFVISRFAEDEEHEPDEGRLEDLLGP